MLANNDDDIRDATQLLAIFPEEIWIMILEQIKKPKDLTNFCNASLYLRHLFLPKRVNFLFPEVWAILSTIYHQNFDPEKENEENDNDNGLQPTTTCIGCGRLRRSRWCSEILIFRLVSRDWCQTIDTFYQEKKNYREIEDEMDDLGIFDWLKNDFSFPVHHAGTVQQTLHPRDFLQHFTNHPGNPFFGRRCALFMDSELNRTVELDQFVSDIINVFLKYGKNIWYFTIFLSNPFPTIVEWYQRVRESLEKMPNLKEVYITLYSLRSISNDEISTLNQEISINPLPRLRHLDFIRTRFLPGPIFNEIIRRNNQISCLKAYRLEMDGVYNLHTVSLPKLKILELEIHSREEFEMLSNLAVGSCPLEQLKLKINANIERVEIFNLLDSAWANTLIHLELIIPIRNLEGITVQEILEECLTSRLNLSKLKSLELWMGTLSCLDFILPLKTSLEVLKISFHEDMSALEPERRNKLCSLLEKRQTIKFMGWTERMLESNIWSNFEKLKLIKLRHHQDISYTRDEWTKEMNKKRLVFENI